MYTYISSSVNYNPVSRSNIPSLQALPNQYTQYKQLGSNILFAPTDNTKYWCQQPMTLCSTSMSQKEPIVPSLALLGSSTSDAIEKGCCSSTSLDGSSTSFDNSYEKDETQMIQEEYHYDDSKPLKLLPVLNYQFNAREICKQCIMLEDHLTHPEKRCYDCCMKHFLAIEGFAEEALTLDKDYEIGKGHDVYVSLLDLPGRIRQLQQKYYEAPVDNHNCHEIAQQLRQVRKTFQSSCFGIIFKDYECQDGSCMV